MDGWVPRHAMLAPFGILVATLYLWQWGDHPLTIDRAADFVELGSCMLRCLHDVLGGTWRNV